MLNFLNQQNSNIELFAVLLTMLMSSIRRKDFLGEFSILGPRGGIMQTSQIW